MAIEAMSPTLHKGGAYSKTPQRNERRSGDRNQGKPPRRSNSPSSKPSSGKGQVPHGKRPEKVKQGRSDS